MKKNKWKFVVVAAIGCFSSQGAWAVDGPQKPIEVNGQSRNLNMMLVLRNDKDKIKFVKIRENYRNEILEESGDPSQKSKTKTEEN